MTLTERQVIWVYKAALGREPEPGITATWLAAGIDRKEMLERVLASPEFALKAVEDAAARLRKRESSRLMR